MSKHFTKSEQIKARSCLQLANLRSNYIASSIYRVTYARKSKVTVRTGALPWAQAPAPNMASVYERASVGDNLTQAYDSFIPKNAIKRRAGIILHPTSLPVSSEAKHPGVPFSPAIST
jgi:hypothetical protein